VEMMKIFAVVAIVAVAVCAKSITFKQERLPCSYTLKSKVTVSGREVTSPKSFVNGRYIASSGAQGDQSFFGIVRPDITRKEDGREQIASFVSLGKNDCTLEWMNMTDYLAELKDYDYELFLGFNNATWDKKESVKYQGKKCDHYYNETKDSPSIYVYDDFIYVIHMKTDEDNDMDIIYDFNWDKVKMDKFIMKKDDFPACYKLDKRIADEPSKDYVFCGASSLKVAFVSILVALATVLF